MTTRNVPALCGSRPGGDTTPDLDTMLDEVEKSLAHAFNGTAIDVSSPTA
jgi:hypothetical protein